MNRAQWKFIHSEILTMSLMAAFAHVRVYKEGTSDADRRKLQDTLRKELRNVSDQYGKRVDDAQHLKNIETLAANIARVHRDTLEGERFGIGPAQKALNLYLKYLWCFGHIEEPPHCPLDAKILAKAPKLSGKRWTQLGSAGEYMECIDALREIARGKSLSLTQWECEKWPSE
jgi:hypothetical protein